MRNRFIVVLCCFLSVIGVAQTSVDLCTTTNSTSVITGTIYDSGGQFGNYMDSESCQFLIQPGCNATITLSFSQFFTESCCDFLSIYNGSNTAAPLLGNYSGSTLPPNIVANSGSMFLNWSTDGSVTGSGFVATWTAVVSGTIAPVANFTMNPNPALNTAFQFTDLTTNMPNQWFWQFGDATTSTAQNPIKAYTTPGLKTVTLSATNCNTTNIVTQTLMVQSAPSISVAPSPLTATTTCGSSVVVPLNVYNNGSGALNFTLNGNYTNQIKVLAITNYVDMSFSGEYNNTFAAINSYFTNYTVTPHTLVNVPAFQAALAGKDVLLIPEQETYPGLFMQTYSTSIINFVNSGGTAILCGSGNLSQVNDIGLFSCTNMINTMSNITVVDTNDFIMTTVPIGTMASPNATWYSIFTNPGNVDYVKSGTSNVVTKRLMGLGRAIYIGFDYYNYTTNSAKIIANAVKSAVTYPSWITTTVTSSSVAPSSSTSITFTFNANNISAGTYTYNLIINSNDPVTPTISVPVSYTVYGAPSVSVSPNCIAFGSVFQNTNKLDSVTIYNTGCATLSVSAMTATNSVFSYSPSGSYTVAAWSSKKIYVNFNPLLVGSYIDTLFVFNNDVTKKICLSGFATLAPSISVTPASLSVALPACNGTQTMALNIFNLGGPNLTFTINGNSSSNGTVNILAITNYVDMSVGGEYNNTIAAINSYFTNTNITPHNLSNVPSFQSALVGKQVLLIPEQESYVNGFMQTYSTTILNFVNSGGTAILCGSGSNNQVNDVGLFNSTSTNWGPPSITVVDTNDVIMKTLPMGNITPPNATLYNTFTNPGIIDYVKYSGSSVVSKRNVGSGRAIYLGFDYYALDVNTSKMIANSVKSCLNSVTWLTSNVTTASVAPSSSTSITYTFNTGNLTAGTYTFNVVINSNDPVTPTVTVPITMVVGNNPCANFSFTNPNNCSGTVTFTQNVINTVTSYSWNFGNSTSSTLANPTCNYTLPGTYSVTLTACNGTLCSSITKTLTITNVGGPISAACTPTNLYNSTNYGIMNVSFNTINNASSYTWPEGGYKDFSCTNQTSITIGSNYLLMVTTSPFNNENVSVWIDYDNNGSFSNGELVLQSMNVFGTHTINLTPPANAVLYTPLRMRVIDDASSYTIFNGCTNTYYGQTEDYAVTIIPNNIPPVANFVHSINACQGTVSFTDMSTNNPTSWLWNFGNSAASNLQNPVYTYTVPGTYTVTLIATNAFGSAFYTTTITVNPLAFTIAYSNNNPNVINLPITFTTNLLNGISYVWDFGDGNFGGTASSVNTYTVPGTYVVKLTIVSGTCVNTMSTTIVIVDPSNPTSLNGNSNNEFNLSVYPNPFKNETRINLVVNKADEIKLEIVNSLGQKLEQYEFTDMRTGNNTFVLKDFKPGIYFLKVSNNSKVSTYKLISVN